MKNLYQRINDVRKAIGYVQKDKTVSAGAGGNYKAVTHDMVTAMIRSHMIDAGIIIYPVQTTSTMTPPFGDGKQWRYAASYDFHVVNADTPEDRLMIHLEAHAMDNADKAPGKALSYAKKYALLKLFEIETGEDEESRVSEKGLDESVLGRLCDSITAANTMQELQSAYKEAYKQTQDAEDKQAAAIVIKAKDRRKVQLTAMLAEQA